jgi:hypothetical protein
MPQQYQGGVAAPVTGTSIEEDGGNAERRPLSMVTVTIVMVTVIFGVSIMSVMQGLI